MDTKASKSAKDSQGFRKFALLRSFKLADSGGWDNWALSLEYEDAKHRSHVAMQSGSIPREANLSLAYQPGDSQ